MIGLLADPSSSDTDPLFSAASRNGRICCRSSSGRDRPRLFFPVFPIHSTLLPPVLRTGARMARRFLAMNAPGGPGRSGQTFIHFTSRSTR